jgi:hypothetical protein
LSKPFVDPPTAAGSRRRRLTLDTASLAGANGGEVGPPLRRALHLLKDIFAHVSADRFGQALFARLNGRTAQAEGGGHFGQRWKRENPGGVIACRGFRLNRCGSRQCVAVSGQREENGGGEEVRAGESPRARISDQERGESRRLMEVRLLKSSRVQERWCGGEEWNSGIRDGEMAGIAS